MAKKKSTAPTAAQSQSKTQPDRKKLNVKRLDDANYSVLQARGIVYSSCQALKDGDRDEVVTALEAAYDLLEHAGEQLTEENLLAPAEAQEVANV